MSSRPPSRPPRLAGYEYEQLLGSGGFADVFLYRQFRPQRRVAIKVLLSNVLDESVHRLFDAEANVMAQMSTHPSIVTIHQAEVPLIMIATSWSAPRRTASWPTRCRAAFRCC